MTKTERLERQLADLLAGKIKPAHAERLLFTDVDGNQVRLSAPDAADKMRARIEAERNAQT
jgi:hypothetical protein